MQNVPLSQHPRSCPFCGGVAAESRPVPYQIGATHVLRQVMTCPECGASGPRAVNAEDAQTAWNVRSPAAVQP